LGVLLLCTINYSVSFGQRIYKKVLNLSLEANTIFSETGSKKHLSFKLQEHCREGEVQIIFSNCIIRANFDRKNSFSIPNNGPIAPGTKLDPKFPHLNEIQQEHENCFSMDEDNIPVKNPTFNQQLSFTNRDVRVVKHYEETTIIAYDVNNYFLRSVNSSKFIGDRGDGGNS
jgi:hypothetical protein